MQESKTEKKTHVIDGVTYVEVARKVEVGEKIITLNYIEEHIKVGDTAVVIDANYKDGSVETANPHAFFDTAKGDEYLVLEPVAYPRDEVIETLIREVDELKIGQRALFKMISRDLPTYDPADLNGKQVTLFTASDDGDYSLIVAKDEDDRLYVISETGAA